MKNYNKKIKNIEKIINNKKKNMLKIIDKLIKKKY